MSANTLVILDEALVGYFDEACPFNPLSQKPKESPTLSTCLQALKHADVEETLKWEKNGDIRRLAKLVTKGSHHSSPYIKKQAQAVADMVTGLHVFGEMSLQDRSYFLAAAPLSLKKVLSQAYDLGRRFLNLFREEPDERRTNIVADAVDKLKTVITKVPKTNDVFEQFNVLYRSDEKLKSMGSKEKSVYLSVMQSFSKDIQQTNFA